MQFNKNTPTIAHLDVNSCFATCEQQANPFLRHKPVAVCAYTTPSGCVLAASYEAKGVGVKTGMRLSEAKLYCPDLLALVSDPPKYRFVHKKLKKLISLYAPEVVAKSIDEFVFDLSSYCQANKTSALEAVSEIKGEIKRTVGEYITVSVGISTNRYLAKLGASLKKPDGLTIIDHSNYQEIFSNLKLTDLPGIKLGNSVRLKNFGINTVLDFSQRDSLSLRFAMKSILGHYWFLRLHGFEIDNIETTRKSFGNSYSLPKPSSEDGYLIPILLKLVQKASERTRKAGKVPSAVGLYLRLRGASWHRYVSLRSPLYSVHEYQMCFLKLFEKRPKNQKVRLIAITLTKLRPLSTPLFLFPKDNNGTKITQALDKINRRYGPYTLTSARVKTANGHVHDRISFGNVEP